MKKILTIYSYIMNNGLVWLFFRVYYELKRRLGWFYLSDILIKKRTNNINLSLVNCIGWNIVNKKFNSNDKYIEKADKALSGNIFSFSHSYLNYLEKGVISNINPETRILVSMQESWHKIPDFGPVGDIKLIWEVSRFPQVFYFIGAHKIMDNKKYADGCLTQILDWVDFNPYPYGPNYKCGQEISFRLFAWIIALDYFEGFVTNVMRKKIITNIYTSLLRINSNINYALKSVKNNHSISEASGLFIGGLLFPDFPESEKWVQKGLKLLLQETVCQISDDGSYIQHSMNYHRLAMDILSFVMHIAKISDYKLPVILFERHEKMCHFLASFVQKEGRVPNYGSNDGAYLFPLSEYQDFRQSLNFASAVNNGNLIFKGYTSIVDFFGIKYKDHIYKEINTGNFNTGGYYQLKNKIFYCFIRCHKYFTKPAHSDALHLDVWANGKNIFCDTGTFSYNTDIETKKHFSGIFGHNTIVINNMDYMSSVFNFGKTNWPNSKMLSVTDTTFEGEHYGYRSINGISHRRQVILRDGSISVKDYIYGIKESTYIVQQWHTEYPVKILSENEFEVQELKISSNVKGKVIPSKVSRYYNSYSESSMLSFSLKINSDFTIETVFNLY